MTYGVGNASVGRQVAPLLPKQRQAGDGILALEPREL